ncbi:MAG TPA: hypothetical protein VFG00_06520 [Acidothermaceae bacterium]|nr:hypothetical protein [Acidothermaceae bacterium]
MSASVGERPRVAVLCSVYFAGSHADVILGRLLDGYTWDGVHQQARIEVASVYLEQLGSSDNEPTSCIDIGVRTLTSHGIPLFGSVGEALSLGGTGVNVDGVVIIGEHGDYGWGEFEQKLYPRRRMFDASVAAMVAAGRKVPVFVDKHLAWSFIDAASMVSDADRLGVPLSAGSSVPLTWRIPQGADWPMGSPVTGAAVVSIAASEPGCRPTEMSGFHNLEFVQALLERRRGGETGVAAVTAITGSKIAASLAAVPRDAELLVKALEALAIKTDDPISFIGSNADDLFLVDYLDGTTLTVVNLDLPASHRVAGAVRGPETTIAMEAWLGDPAHGNFTFLTRQIESLMLTGRSPYPIARTLLTTGVMEAALRARRERRTVPTPYLSLSYTAVPVTDTGIDRPAPRS